MVDKEPTRKWWKRSWTFPASVLLHVLIVAAFYLQWPTGSEITAEPESVAVELVQPPEPEAKPEPPGETEEQKAEEPSPPTPPPPEEQKPQEPPPSVQPSLPAIALRPDAVQDDARDQPGRQEEQGGSEQPKPADEAKAENAQKAEETPEEQKPEDAPTQEADQQPSALAATSPEGEVAAAEIPDENAAIAVPLPRPPTPPTSPKPNAPQEPVEAGAGNPELKPARNILSGATMMNPMLRQMMGDLPPRRRIVQLCSTEALAQIIAERAGQSQPEGIVPYTGKGGMIGGNVLNASGGAFNVGAEWYSITFRCEVDVDNYAVTDFSYQIGNKLSPSEVRKRGLPIQ